MILQTSTIRFTLVNQTPYPANPEIVKVDGTRIKAIREGKGLTQLYVATAVEVTTDTVSRWENKRYPTIKKDNALRLATALEVALEDILDQDDVVPDTPVFRQTTLDEDPSPAAEKTAAANPNRLNHWRRAVFLAVCLVLIVAALLWSLFKSRQPSESLISVSRSVPPHFVSGRPFPVFLHIQVPSNKPVSIILRETIPHGLSLAAATPAISGQDKKDYSIKWLQKLSGDTIFAYTLVSDSSFTGSIQFDGMLKVTGQEMPETHIGGDRRSVAGLHHWADTNRDNRISDEEILAVYDSVGTSRDIGIDMELIEDIWLGDGYRWETQQQRFIVLE